MYTLEEIKRDLLKNQKNTSLSSKKIDDNIITQINDSIKHLNIEISKYNDDINNIKKNVEINKKCIVNFGETFKIIDANFTNIDIDVNVKLDKVEKKIDKITQDFNVFQEKYNKFSSNVTSILKILNKK